MGEILNSLKGVKSAVPEIVSISFPHVAAVTIHIQNNWKPVIESQYKSITSSPIY